MSQPLLSLVLPVRDQADHIARVLDGYLRALEPLGTFELVVVVNASRDASARIVRELAERDARVRLLEEEVGGWGRSVRRGLAAAHGRFVGYTNSARTEPSTVRALFARLARTPGSLVKLRRYARGDLGRAIGSLLFNLQCQLLLGIEACDVNGTPKLFDRALLDRLELRSDGDLLDAELLARCRRLRVPVAEVRRAGFARHGGVSTTGLATAARLYGGAVGLWWRLARAS